MQESSASWIGMSRVVDDMLKYQYETDTGESTVLEKQSE